MKAPTHINPSITKIGILMTCCGYEQIWHGQIDPLLVNRSEAKTAVPIKCTLCGKEEIRAIGCLDMAWQGGVVSILRTGNAGQD
jgi:hypothetical protein